MTMYVFHLLDRPDSAKLRTSMRPQHLAYLGEMADRIAFAGPLLADDGQSIVGSLLAIEFESRVAAQEWLSDEPFARIGVYDQVVISVFSNRWLQKVGFPSDD